MKTRKTVIAVLTAVLISAVLIASCISPLEEALEGKIIKQDAQTGEYQSGSSESGGNEIDSQVGDDQIIDIKNGDIKIGSYKIPKGKGIVRVKVSEKNARTILPDAGDIPAVSTLFFDVQFKGNSSNTNPGTDTNYPANPSDPKYSYSAFNNVPFVLDNGDYDVIITAYVSSGGMSPTFTAIAGYDSAALNEGPYEVDDDVTEIGTITEPINLIIINGMTAGNFHYEITYADLVTTNLLTALVYSSQTLDVFDYTDTTYSNSVLSGGNAIDISTDPGVQKTGTVSLPSGYYTVIIKLVASNCQDRIVKNVMHVYPTLTSKYINNTIPAPNQNKFTVTFDLNGVTVMNGDSTFNVDLTGSGGEDTSGLITQILTNAQTVEDPGVPANDGYTFGGWYPTKGTGNGVVDGTEWVLGTSGTKVYRDRTLYAKWEPNAGAAFTITFNFASPQIVAKVIDDPTSAATEDTSGDPVSLADIKGDVKSIEFTLTGGTFTNIVWELNLDSPYTDTLSGDTFTIDSSSTFLDELVTGTYNLTVTGEKDYAPWNAEITFNISND